MNELTPINRSQYSERPEYQEVTLDELGIMTDMADELLVATSQMIHHYNSASSFDNKSTYITKTFSYIESGLSSGWMWPLTETQITITYNKSLEHPTTERYQFGVSRIVEQRGLSDPNILSVYTVEFFGKNRESAQATIDTHDLAGDSPSVLVGRPMTSYDNEVLFDELGNLWNLHTLEEKEESQLKKFN